MMYCTLSVWRCKKDDCRSYTSSMALYYLQLGHFNSSYSLSWTLNKLYLFILVWGTDFKSVGEWTLSGSIPPTLRTANQHQHQGTNECTMPTKTTTAATVTYPVYSFFNFLEQFFWTLFCFNSCKVDPHWCGAQTSNPWGSRHLAVGFRPVCV